MVHVRIRVTFIEICEIFNRVECVSVESHTLKPPCINLNFVSGRSGKKVCSRVSTANGTTRDSRGKLFFNFPCNQEGKK